MFKSKTISPRRARQIYELEKLRSEIEANQRRMAELEAIRNAPCPACMKRGWVAA